MRILSCSESRGPDDVFKASWSPSSSLSSWRRPRTFSLSHALPLMYFWLIVSPDYASEIMTVLWWCCPDPLSPLLHYAAFFRLLGKLDLGWLIKTEEFASSSHKIPSPQHILPRRFCIPGIPPSLQPQSWANGLCLSGTDWIKYCSHSRWWNQDLEIKITGLMSQR